MDPAPRARLQDAYPGAAAWRVSSRCELGAARLSQRDELQPRCRADGGRRGCAVAVFALIRSGAPASYPGERFVSDGDPNTVTVPTSHRDHLRDEFRAQRVVVR